MEADDRPTLSVVVPCYNEEDVIEMTCERVKTVLDGLDITWEVVLVDDGSRDTTWELLKKIHTEDPRFRAISLSRNFGHQPAVYAGLQNSRGQAVGVIDADLQDPPEILVECLQRWQKGYQVIYGIRQKRKENIFKRTAYKTFYLLFRKMASIDAPLDSGDFCVMDRAVVETILSLPERHIFVRGMRAWSGFKSIGVAYARPARAAGEPKYSLMKLFQLAADGIFSFSVTPLRFASYVGTFVVGFCLAAILFVITWRLAGFEFMGSTARELPGWAGVIVSVFFLGGVQLLFLGILGEYVARIYNEVKRRPRWVAKEYLGNEFTKDV